MPRQPRYFIPNIPQHVIARGIDRQAVFFQARDYQLYRQAMGRTYVQRLNARYQRTGTLWEGRYKASLVQTDHYLLACQRYIELNPVRAGMVAAPGEYAYSSYGHHALGKEDPLLTSHANYLELHADLAARLQAYRALFSDTLSEALLTRLRENTNACTVIGNDRFKEQIATMLGRAVPTGKRGRPKKLA